MDFSHLKKHDIKDKTVDYPLYQIAGDPTPVLVLKHAGQSNKPYFNAVLRSSRKSIRAIKSNKMDSAMLEENRKEDKSLFPKYVIVGWRDVQDSHGNIVDFTQDNCQDFVNALPDWIFDEVRNFAADTQNFSEELVIDAEAKAKN